MPKTARIIDGKKVAASIRAELSEEVKSLKAKGITPGLAVVLVGDDPASHVYVRGKEKGCAEVGMASFVHRLPADATERRVLNLVRKLNDDPRVHGLLVQSPLPPQIDEMKVVNAINPEKDADGFHPVQRGPPARWRAGPEALHAERRSGSAQSLQLQPCRKARRYCWTFEHRGEAPGRNV